MDRQGIKHYLDAVWGVVADANRYFAGEEPWAKRKTDFKRMETILYVTAEVVRQVAILAPAGDAGGGRASCSTAWGRDRMRAASSAGRGGAAEPGTASRHRASRFPRRRAEPDAVRRYARARPGRARWQAAVEDQADPRLMLVDHHCHLDFPDFAADLDGSCARAARPASG